MDTLVWWLVVSEDERGTLAVMRIEALALRWSCRAAEVAPKCR